LDTYILEIRIEAEFREGYGLDALGNVISLRNFLGILDRNPRMNWLDTKIVEIIIKAEFIEGYGLDALGNVRSLRNFLGIQDRNPRKNWLVTKIAEIIIEAEFPEGYVDVLGNVMEFFRSLFWGHLHVYDSVYHLIACF
jgi:hypothetical protein